MYESELRQFVNDHKYALMFFAFISVVALLVINNPFAPVPTSANTQYRPVKSLMQFSK